MAANCGLIRIGFGAGGSPDVPHAVKSSRRHPARVRAGQRNCCIPLSLEPVYLGFVAVAFGFALGLYLFQCVEPALKFGHDDLLVAQVFGKLGRPALGTRGVGCIITLILDENKGRNHGPDGQKHGIGYKTDDLSDQRKGEQTGEHRLRAMAE